MCSKQLLFVLCVALLYKKVLAASSPVTKETLEKQYSRLSENLKKNSKTLEDLFTQFRRKSRSVASPVAFFAGINRSYHPMSPHQVIPFNNAPINIGNGYDQQFGLFQAPVSGYYQFVLTCQADQNYMVNLEMVKNGNLLCRAHAATQYQEGFCVAMVHLDKGDDVWVRHYNGEGTYLYDRYSVPSFSGHLIKAT